MSLSLIKACTCMSVLSQKHMLGLLTVKGGLNGNSKNMVKVFIV